MSAASFSLIHAFKWSMASEIASKVIQPIVFIVLARLLTPDDFGVMSSALMVISFSQIFWEAGMGKALIQRQTDIEAAANVAFWINIALGSAITMLLFVAASPIAQTFFYDERVTAVIQFMTLQVFLGATTSVHTALLQKEMGFKRLFWIRFITVGLPGLASIPLAWYGMGYWALVMGTLVGQLTQVLVLWRLSPWRPSWTFDVPVAKEMAYFGAWVGLTGLLAWGYSWLDGFIVIIYFGVEKLGLFRTGNQFAIAVFSLFFSFYTPVLYASFSLINIDSVGVREQLFRISRLVPVVSLPLAMGVVLFRVEIETILFGSKWSGIAYVIAMIAIKESVLWIFAYNIEAYRALGQPKLETIIAFGSVLLSPLVLIYFASKGFNEFVFARSIILGLIGVTIHVGVASYHFGICGRTYLRILVYIVLCLCSIAFGLALEGIVTIFVCIVVKLVLPFLLFILLLRLEINNLRHIVLVTRWGNT